MTWTSREVVSTGRLATMPSARRRAKAAFAVVGEQPGELSDAEAVHEVCSGGSAERSIRMSKGPSKR